MSTASGATAFRRRPVGLRAAVWLVAALTAPSGVVAAWRMYETHPCHHRAESAVPR